MKKKGFTLVELLAVIAILAILVIIALPNVMGMFNQAKKSSFTTEIKNIYKVAQQAWMIDSMMSTNAVEYSRCSTCTGKSLDLSGRSELEYYIKIDKAGNVVNYVVDDGTYNYKYNGPGLAINEIKDSDVTTSTGGELMNRQVFYLGDNADGYYTLGATVTNIPTTYTSPEAVMSTTGRPFFSKVTVENGVVTSMEVGFRMNGRIYSVYGGSNSNYNERRDILLNAFGAEHCTLYDGVILCNYEGLAANSDSSGDIAIYNDYECIINNNRIFCDYAIM